MNVFIFELRSVARTLLIWTAALTLLLTVMIGTVFPMYLDSRPALEKALAGFPPAFLSLFGFRAERIFTFGGFYAFAFLYLALIGAILAAQLALTVFARERRTFSEDFLYVKPRRRLSIFLAKLFACLAALGGVNLICGAALIIVARQVVPDLPPDRALALNVLALPLTQLVFLAIGALYGALARHLRSVSGTAAAIGIAAFVSGSLVRLLDLQALRLLAPLDYFSPADVHERGGFDPAAAICGSLVIVAGLILAGWLAVRQDRRIR